MLNSSPKHNRPTWLCCISWGLLFMGCLATGVKAQEETATQVYRKTLPSTVWIVWQMEPGRYSTGTGWVIDRTLKLVITNHHVVEGTEQVSVYFPQVDPDNPTTIMSDSQWYLDKGK